ncbi:TetR/AcrR family transcriptional regulator [Nonomuraea typhae]|uniref:TetR/AcrR family transcriptional regulator n=1 Tax=Nonomuraea typhae TaxID=2603600 RepID=UPI001C67E1ED|nr:TetR/AcrR family transcriptional regulator [Nonomuraea typhae]
MTDHDTKTGPLPSGRHHLSREQVVSSQRGRMLKAMRESMMERGYVGTSVTDVVRRAGVSRETFYQQFTSKQDCFVQGLDEAMDTLSGNLRAAGSRSFRSLLRVYLRTLAADPALARLYLVEVYAAGPEAMARRTANQQRFAGALAEMFQARTGEQRFACLALVAAVAQLVTAALVQGDMDALLALEEPLAALAERLLPVSSRE